MARRHDRRLPTKAIEYCLAEAGLSTDELSYVVFYDKPIKKFDRILETYFAYAPSGFASFRKALPLWLEEKSQPIYRTPGPKLDFMMKIFEHAASIAKERGIRLVIVLFDNQGTFNDRKRFGTDDVWSVFRTELEKRTFEVIDTSAMAWAMFKQDPKSVINPAGQHYVPSMNGAVAKAIAERLRQ